MKKLKITLCFFLQLLSVFLLYLAQNPFTLPWKALEWSAAKELYVEIKVAMLVFFYISFNTELWEYDW